jgi:hypothetical protein
MTIGETVRKAIKEISDGILDMISLKDFTLTDDKPKRARTKKGRYKSDDPSTPDVNEAYVGGKAPTRKQLLGLKKKKTKRKTKRKK